MPSPRKTFDKADLLTFLTETDDEAAVGDFTVIRPSPTLFDQTESTTHEVQAITEAFWCERYQLALVIQRARVTGAGANALPVHHPLAVAHRTGKSEPRVNMRYGGTSSQLVRWAAELADAWRYEIANLVPCVPIDLTSETPTITVGRLEIRQYFNWTGTANPELQSAESEPEPVAPIAPEPEVDADDPDHAPTGTTIDDVFAGHDNDDGDESEGQA